MNIDISNVAKNISKWRPFEIRAGKLARKNNGHFQSTAVKSKTRNFLDSRKTKSRVIALIMLKCHFSPTVKVKPRYRGDVLSRGRAWFAFCFLLNEVGDLSFYLA